MNHPSTSVRFSATIVVAGMLVCGSCTIIDRATPDFMAFLSIQHLHRAQEKFRSQFGRYATLPELGPDGSHLIEQELAEGLSDGYRVTITLPDDGYVIEARPLRWPKYGRRSFYSDESRIVHQVWTNEPATRESEVLK
jgi:hypothetical protein